ncbi:hypothetical protein F5884DRAFT_174985 [Xylogone sp. PMI_703]|nr:hypothetical protein F5884DRAFT_174985 [Xylogone sp. PMI_703]
MAAPAAVPPPSNGADTEDVFEEGPEPDLKTAQTIHHIRANSTIMKLKKILGKHFPPPDQQI